MNIEEAHYEGYLQAIDQIDRLLQKPIETLAKLFASRWRPKPGDPAPLLALPPRLVEGVKDEPAANLNTALCCSTLQRIWIQRRRFPNLKEQLKELRTDLQEGQPVQHTVPECLAEPFLLAARSARTSVEYARLFANPNGSALDPTTAAQVQWVLINAGEKNLLSPAGFISFFFILWALHRKLPEAGGVAAGAAPPSAYMTAKCLSPVLRLLAVLRRRADLFDSIAKSIGCIQELQDGDRSSLPMRLDELSAQLQEVAVIAISRDGFNACAAALDSIADRSQGAAGSQAAGTLAKVNAALLKALRALGRLGQKCLAEADRPVNQILARFVDSLATAPDKALETHGFKEPAFRDPMRRAEFNRDLKVAARRAHKDCVAAFNALRQITNDCRRLTGADAPRLPKLFKKLADANRKVADSIEPATIDAINWCEEVLTRQVAHASAKNLTEFDPAELLAALFVTVAGRRLESTLPVKDAIEKALTGLREDGSWLPGQPFLVVGYLGAWAPTSDLIWLLSSTLDRLPAIRTADKALGMFVDWLDRTQRRLRYEEDSKGARKLSVACGWISERDLLPGGIDLWATAYAINALLGIREIMEFRVWEICEKRFTVLRPDRRLSGIDAVDLGVRHKHRLHRRLARMMRKASGDDYLDAEYSLILHGPPGSSKTAITAALASEMWRSADGSGKLRGRLIRVTPADFTRLGESRLDSEARIIFDLLMNIRGVTVLFDEIDDLLRRRENEGAVAFLDLVVPAMLNRLQDLRDACPAQEVCFVLATNYVDRLEPALIRKGRIDRPLSLVYPDRESRRSILRARTGSFSKRNTEAAPWAASRLEAQGDSLLAATDYWPWKTYDGFCGEACRAFEGVYCEEKEAAARDAESARRLERLLAQTRASVATRIYTEKRFRNRSPELRDEVIEYCLSGTENTAETIAALLALTPKADDFRNGKPHLRRVGKHGVELSEAAAKALAEIFGDDAVESLRMKVRRRGWDAVKVQRI